MDATASLPVPEIPLSRYRFGFRLTQPVNKLPAYLGSALRGAFGHSLKRLACTTRQESCQGCALIQSCAYSYIFETPPPPDTPVMRKYTAAPHPFVFNLPLNSRDAIDTDGNLRFGMTLFGHANQHLPFVFVALESAGQHGLGPERIELTLESVEQQSSLQVDQWQTIYCPGQTLDPQPGALPEVPPMPQRVRLHFHTPVRLQQSGRLVTPETFDFSSLFNNLLRRISMLIRFHTDTPFDTDFQQLSHASREVSLADQQLRMHHWNRYSSRQKTRMKMDGLIGHIELDMTGLDAFWPWLWLGQWTHAGKATSMGLGSYQIELASLS